MSTTQDQTTQRTRLYALLGDLPPRDRPVSAEVVAREARPGYTLEVLLLNLNGIEPVPAYFTRPATWTEATGRVPAVIYNHAHGGDYVLGKDEYLTGRSALQKPPYAEALAALGVCGLCIDSWNFGERRGRTESELFKELLWHGQVLWGLMVYDTLKATDYLVSRSEVDPNRLGSMGLSMGSTMAWWHAALDERVRVCVDLCCLTDFQALVETRGLDGHGIYYYVPDLLKHFTTAEINALIAPRAHLSLAGIWDRLTPPAGLDRIDAALREVYAAAGAPERWQLVRYNTGHFETWDMRARVLRFLQRFLVQDS
ncbi:MAG: acetylxylan esterase [Chloroflexi bacterium]|nr:acetylxylan esterase [Chloroflexota bacterium]